MTESVRSRMVRREAGNGPRALSPGSPRAISSFDGSPSVSEQGGAPREDCQPGGTDFSRCSEAHGSPAKAGASRKFTGQRQTKAGANQQAHQGTKAGEPRRAATGARGARWFPARRAIAKERGARACIRAAGARPVGDEAEVAADAAHRAILHALGLPPFVSKRTLQMFVDFMGEPR